MQTTTTTTTTTTEENNDNPPNRDDDEEVASSSYINEIDVLYVERSWGETSNQYSPMDIKIEFGNKVESWSDCVFKLSTIVDEQKGFVVKISPWFPFACQGGGGGMTEYNFSCVTKHKTSEILNNSDKDNDDNNNYNEKDNDDDNNKKNSSENSNVASKDEAEKEEMMQRSVAVSNWLKTPAGMEKSLSILYDVILTATPTIASQLEIGSLEHDLASKVLLEKLLSANVKKLEFCDFEDETKKQRVLGLCCGLLQNSTSLEELLCFKFVSFNHELGKQLFKSIASSVQPLSAPSSGVQKKGDHHQTSLKSLELPNGRYNATWCKGDKKRRPDDEITIPLSTIEPLFVSLADQRMEALDDGDGDRVRKTKPSFNCLDLGGNTPSNDAMVALATALPKLGLETLKLRDTDLQEEALLQFAKSLHQDKTLKKLDLSSNAVSLEVWKELCSALENNKTLECLFLEYCDLELDHAEYLAEHLPKFVGLRHLHLDGNTFTWKPLQEDETVSIGSTRLVHALEKNHVLLTLELGEFGNVLPVAMSCCTTPPHQAVLSEADSRNLEERLKRNKGLYEEMLHSKEQENIVNVARILLDKI